MNKKKERKIQFLSSNKNKKIIMKIVSYFIQICMVFNIIYFANSIINESSYLKLFGISLFSMETDLMQPDIPKNALVITKKYDKKDIIENNDEIAYTVNNTIRINKIVNYKYIDGEITYKTKSNQNYYMDKENIYRNQIIGKVVAVIPRLGIFLEIIQSPIVTIITFIILTITYFYNKKIYKNKIKRKIKLYNKQKN